MRVSDVLDLLAAGEAREAILADYPYLADEDITAALEYASAGLTGEGGPPRQQKLRLGKSQA
jgi:uncharacterized protein (DUF433 family)